MLPWPEDKVNTLARKSGSHSVDKGKVCNLKVDQKKDPGLTGRPNTMPIGV